MTAVTGSGAWPGVDVLEAQTVVMGELAGTPTGVTGMPFAVRLASRGPQDDPTGSAAGLLVDLPVELGTHGWKLADRPGHDLALAHARRREDVDALAVAGLGWTGPFVVPVTGPVTLAASLYLARGDRVLSDRGAADELAQSLAVGLADHLAAVRRAVPGAELRVLLHEPLLAQAMAGRLPSFSGYSALRSVPTAAAAERLGAVVAAAKDAGAVAVVVHGGEAVDVTDAALRSGADGLALSTRRLGPGAGSAGERAWEVLAAARERGTALWFELAAPSHSDGADGATDGAGGGGTGRARTGTSAEVVALADQVVAPWRRVGLPLGDLSSVVLLPQAPTAGSSPDHARAALAAVARAALVVAERAEG